MKTKTLLLTLALIGASTLATAAETASSSGSGDWDKVKWNNDRPGNGGRKGTDSFDLAGIRSNNTITLTTNANAGASKPIRDLWFGANNHNSNLDKPGRPQFGILDINDGGSITLTGNIEMNRKDQPRDTCRANTLNLNGGAITLSSAKGTLNIGNLTQNVTGKAPAPRRAAASVNFNAGTFTGSINIGSSTPDFATGTLTINGSMPKISGSSLNLNPTATLAFILDSTGSSTLAFKTAAFSDGAQIIVDGSRYTGTSTTITLLKAGTFTNSAKLQTQNFPSSCTATFEVKDSALILTIKKK